MRNENGKIAAVVATALLGAALLLVPLRFPREAAAAVCSKCSASDCCGDSCSGNETCSGSIRYGCYCKCSPSCSCASYTCAGSTCSNGCGGTCSGTKDCSTPPPYACAQCGQTNCCDDNCNYYAPARTCVGNRMSGCYCKTPAPTSTPAPTPTTTATPGPGTCGAKGDCVTNADCPNDPTDGDTCVVTKNPGECWCTKETDPSTYDCAPYRDCYYSDGKWYQQWKCCKTVAGQLDCFYQIRQTCEGVVTPTPTPTSTPTPSPTPSCAVSFSPTWGSVIEGHSTSYAANVTPVNGTVTRVDFAPSNTGLASVSPAYDATSPYSVTATGISPGSVSITGQAVMGGAVRCSGTTYLLVRGSGPWWQVRDGDVVANGSLTSLIPFGCSLPACEPSFGLDGGGGFPGIPGFVGTIDVGTSGSVSSTGWSAEGAPGTRRSYSYSYFSRQIPPDVEFTEIPSGSVEGSLFESGGALSRGAYWYRYDGSSGIDLTVTGDADLGQRKVVLLVANADLYLNGRINLTKGKGFFAAIVGRDGDGNGGNIAIGPAVGGAADGVPELEGLFFADSEFGTGEGNSQLHVRGSVAGLSGIDLRRDLGDDSRTPAELFEYAPDLILNLPSSLRTSRYDWREVAP